MISISMTASFDVNLAREVGYPAAILYNKLLWLSQTDMVQRYDSDGWFYYTAKDFEEATDYNKDTFTRAVKKLVDTGYIEKKKAYIKHTSISVNHFRFLKYHEPNSHQTRIGGVSSDASPLYKGKNKGKHFGFTKIGLEAETLQPSAGSSAVADAPAETGSSFSHSSEGQTSENSGLEGGLTSLSAGGGSRSALNAGGVVKNTTPFDGEVKDVKGKKDMLTPKAFALAQELLPIIDPNDKDIVSTARLVKSALARGVTPEQLRYVARASRSDDWYYDKSAPQVLAKDAIKALLAKQKKKEGPSNMTKEARLYWG